MTRARQPWLAALSGRQGPIDPRRRDSPRTRALAGTPDALTERVLTAIGELDIPDPWGVEEFSRSVSRHTGRPIRIEPYPATSAPSERPCGIWIRGDSTDIVFFDPSTSRYHAEHTILHELGHVVMDRFGWPEQAPTGCDDVVASVSELLAGGLYELDAEVISQMLCRTSFENDQEEEAELFASLLMSRRHRVRERGLSFRDTILGR
ncbi:hypothetical protein QN239_31905 [Mycolicibacterium sp. Y3]